MDCHSIVPVLRIFDEAKAREFYIDWLGFKIDFEQRFEEGSPIYMGISLGDCHIHLSEHHGDGTPGTVIQIYCTGLREFHRTLTKQVYKYYRPSVEDYQWIQGYICMQVIDPFKNVITFLENEKEDLRG